MLSRRHISLIRSFLILMSLLLLAYQPGNCLDVNISQVDANNFPFIYSTVTVDTSGVGVPDLTQGNFVVTEDGRVQTDFFDVEPPTQGSEFRLVDFVFLIDNSGSMCGEINAVRNNVNAFANTLASQGYDYRLGAVRFGQGSGSGNPQIFNNGNMTGDLSTFHSWINAMYCSGSREPGLQAVIDAATSFNFRAGSQRHFLLITDEDSDWGSLSTAINVCLANNIVVHVAVICHSGSSYNQYCRPNTSISGATGGRVFSVVGPYNSILDDLGEVIGNTYVVHYKTDNPIIDGQEREVVIEVDAFGQMDADTGYYTPGSAPQITRTQATIDLSNNAPAEGTPLTIAADIVDNLPPGVNSAKVFYKKIGQQSYSQLNMSNTGGNRYEATIPGGAVETPGVAYYITASDGSQTSTDPETDPGQNPYHIAVLPNEAPEIVHIPVESAEVDQEVGIDAVITDVTNQIDNVYLHYRKTGTLLYDSATMNLTGGDNYHGTIPASIMTEDGADYKLKATDDLGVYTVDGPHAIEPDTSNCWQFQQIKICADNIVEQQPGKFVASGNVVANDVLFFSGDVEISEHPYKISGQGAISVDIIGGPVVLYSGGFEFSLDGPDGALTNFVQSNVNSYFKMAGLDVKLTNLILLHDGVMVAGRLVMPAVLAKTEINIDSLMARLSTGIDIAGKVSHEGNIKIAKTPMGLRKLSLEFDTFNDRYTGAAEVDAKVIAIGADATLEQGQLAEVGVKVEFGKQIPIGSSGLFLTEAGGRVADINNPPPTITVSAGISGGPMVANIAVVELSDMNLSIRPMRMIKGSGTLVVFTVEVAGGFIRYGQNGFDLEGWINLIDVIKSNMAVHLDSTHFHGSANGSVMIPASDVFPLDILSVALGLPYELARAENDVNRDRIRGMTYFDLIWPFPDISLAYQLAFTPSLEFAVGTNYNNLTTIIVIGKQLAALDGDGSLPDERNLDWFTLTDDNEAVFVQMQGETTVPSANLINPTGTVFTPDDSASATAAELGFIELPSLNRSYWIINQPYAGNWAVGDVDAGGEQVVINVYGEAVNAGLSITDVQVDGMNVTVEGVFNGQAGQVELAFGLDEDQEGYDGGYVSEGLPVEPGTFSFTLDASGFPASSYGLFARATQNGETMARTYWPGWVVTESSTAPSPPTGLNLWSTDSTAYASWTPPADSALVDGYIVYWTDLPEVDAYVNNMAVGLKTTARIVEFEPGETQRFMVRSHDADGNESAPSESVLFTYDQPSHNDPPVFTSVPGDLTIVEEFYVYHAQANDPEDGELTFNLLQGPAGMTVDAVSGEVSWNVPADAQGTYDIQLEVADPEGLTAQQDYLLSVKGSAETILSINFDRRHFAGLGTPGVLTVNCTKCNLDPMMIDRIRVAVEGEFQNHTMNWEMLETSSNSGIFKTAFAFGQPEVALDNIVLNPSEGELWTASFDNDGKSVQASAMWASAEEIEIDFDLLAETVNLNSTDRYVTAKIELPEPYDIRQVDMRSLKLNGKLSALVDDPPEEEIVDEDHDGLPERVIRFDHAGFVALVNDQLGQSGLDMFKAEIDFGFIRHNTTLRGHGMDTMKVVMPKQMEK